MLGLPQAQSASLQAGGTVAGLSAPLHDAILGLAWVRQVQAGACIARRGDAAVSWISVVGGALRLGTALRDGREFTLELIGTGQWFGDIALVDERPPDVDLIAHVPSTLLVLSKTDLLRLLGASNQLNAALFRLNCQRLRRMLRRFEEMQMMGVAQRLARQQQRLLRQFGRPQAPRARIALELSQGDLAAMVGGSRKRVNRALRQMHAEGIVQLGQPQPWVLSEARLADVAGRLCVLVEPAVAYAHAGQRDTMPE